jgi:uracil phosphoribosyltransferase
MTEEGAGDTEGGLKHPNNDDGDDGDDNDHRATKKRKGVDVFEIDGNNVVFPSDDIVLDHDGRGGMELSQMFGIPSSSPVRIDTATAAASACTGNSLTTCDGARPPKKSKSNNGSKKKKRPPISDLDLEKQVNQVRDIIGGGSIVDSSLRLTTNDNLEVEEGTKYITLPVSCGKNSPWWVGFELFNPVKHPTLYKAHVLCKECSTFKNNPDAGIIKIGISQSTSNLRSHKKHHHPAEYETITKGVSKTTVRGTNKGGLKHPNLIVLQSKALVPLFTKIRDRDTSSKDFVTYSKRIMRLLAEEAIAYLPGNDGTTPYTVMTPTNVPYIGQLSIVDTNPDMVCAVSIVRAGDSLLESVRDIAPGIRVGKLWIQRNESVASKEAVHSCTKLPKNIHNMDVILCDPMLATGGSSITALDILVVEYGVDPTRIVFANVICCPEGLEALAKKYPTIKIVTCWIDSGLNNEKYIMPGLGDYGDRFFNTV